MAPAFVYLGSDEAAWVTGSELVIDGGMTAQQDGMGRESKQAALVRKDVAGAEARSEER